MFPDSQNLYPECEAKKGSTKKKRPPVERQPLEE
jgi:hypothetical protein